MSFTTLTFVLFLPLVFLAHWLAKGRRGQNLVLLLASYVFYGWWDWRFCLLILFSSGLDFYVARAMSRSSDEGRRKHLLWLSCAVNLGFLGTFKYFNFFAASLVLAANSVGLELSPITLRLILPVGISFYTFQTLSYTIDVYRRELEASDSALDYFTYVAFFPQLVAGPIERGRRLMPQLARARIFDSASATDGARQIMWGLFKKIAIADNLAYFVDMGYGHQCTGAEVFVATIFFAFQIYWDFAAYSDIAIGSARLFGVDLCRNFALPYFSQSVAEFWRRWHMSLSTWFRDYVYIPLGGSRSSTGRKFFNVLLTFTISGLWHGAGWNFVIWGALNGLLTAPMILRPSKTRVGALETPGGDADIPGLSTILRMVGTFLLICSTWVCFRADGLEHALQLYSSMATGLFSAEGWSLRTLGPEGITGFSCLIALTLMAEWIQRRHAHVLVFERLPRWACWGIYTSLLWSALYLQRNEIAAFIYFQF